jgi:hypothetical protein
MKQRHLPSFAIFCLLWTCATPLAFSQPAAQDAAAAQADDLTHRGVDLLKKHQWAEAEALFRQALALKRSYDIAGNLGLAEAGLTKWRDAAEHLTFALSTFPANGKAAHRDLLKEKLAGAREHVGALTIDVDVPAAEVVVDGKGVGTAPLAGEVFVEPGAHVVGARLAGHDAARQEATVAAGASASVKLALPVTVARVADPPQQRVPTGPNKALIISGASIAGAGVGLGAVLAIVASAKASAADSALAKLPQSGVSTPCQVTTYMSACAAINGDNTAHDALAKGALGAFVGAGAIGIATLGYALLAPKGSASSGVKAVPVVGADGARMVVTGVW